jgi:hypothetical protein
MKMTGIWALGLFVLLKKMNTASQPPSAPVQESRGAKSARLMATASCAAPAFAIAINVFNSMSTDPSSRFEHLVIGALSITLYALGLILGMTARAKVKTFGKEGIATPATIGIAINGALLVLVVGAVLVLLAFR